MRFRSENFETFSPPQSFAFEIARDRTESHWAWRFGALCRPSEVTNICCELRNPVTRVISRGSKRISDRFGNFRGREILLSKSREIAPKSMAPGGAQLPRDPYRSRASVASVSMLCRVRFRAIRSRFRSKSRENARKSLPPRGTLALSRPLKVPNICCERQRAVSREIACISERISDRNFRKILRR